MLVGSRVNKVMSWLHRCSRRGKADSIRASGTTKRWYTTPMIEFFEALHLACTTFKGAFHPHTLTGCLFAG